MNEQWKNLQDHQMEIITAVLGLVIFVLVTAVPALAPYKDVLLEIALVIVGLIFGTSVKKGLTRR